MVYLKTDSKISDEDKQLALDSYNIISKEIGKFTDNKVEVQLTDLMITIPMQALHHLTEILKLTSQGKHISLVATATEMTTQAAADYLNCSRPHVVKLLEEGKIEYTKIGKHRRVKYEDLVSYKKTEKAKQKELLIKIMEADEASGLYDTE